MNSLVMILFCLTGLAVAACQPAGSADLAVTDIWGRSSPASAENAAFYMNIRNSGRSQDTLNSAEIDICQSTQLHETNIDDDGVMSMKHVPKIDIPQGQTVSLEPGGLHVMCLGLKSPLTAGEEVPIKLTFAENGQLLVQAEIRENQ